MSRLLYVQIQAVALLQTAPSDLGAQLTIDGVPTGILKYAAVISTNHDAGDTSLVPFDYVEFQIASETFTPQNLSQTSAFATESAPLVYDVWHTVVVPDGFGQLPDLTVQIGSVSPTVISPDDTIKVPLTISNKGGAAANPVTVGIYISDDATIDTGDLLVEASTYPGGALAAGGSLTVTLTDQANSLLHSIPGGKHYIGAIVDYNNAVAESNEANNASKGVLITSTTPAPDLTVSKLTVTPSIVLSTDSIDLGYWLANQGDADAGDAHVGFFLSTDSKVTSSDTLVLDFHEGPTPAGSLSQLLPFAVPISALYQPIATGTYYLGAIVDYDNAVNDSNPANNTSNAVQITVINPDLLPAVPASTLPADAQWAATLDDADLSNMQDHFASPDYDYDPGTDSYSSASGVLAHGLKGLVQHMYDDIMSNIYQELRALAQHSISAFNLAEDFYNTAKKVTGLLGNDLRQALDATFAPLDDAASNPFDADAPGFDGNAFDKSASAKWAKLFADAKDAIHVGNPQPDDQMDEVIDDASYLIQRDNAGDHASIDQWFYNNTEQQPQVVGNSGWQHFFFGGAGNDDDPGGNNDVLYGGFGNDRLTAGTGDSVIIGGQGDDLLTGGTGNDRLWGNDGADTMTGGAGADMLDGGAGSDTVSYAADSAGVTVTLGTNGAKTTGTGGEAQGDIILNVENLVGGSGKDLLTGNALVNALHGGGNDDVLDGGAGNDTLDGGAGNDTAAYASATAAVTVSLLLEGAPQFTGGSGSDTLISIENLTGSSKSGDLLIGDTHDNVLNGGLGNDTLIGGAGADTLIGGGGFDTASYQNDSVGIAIDLTSAGAQSGGEAAGDKLSGMSAVIGGSGADTITGDGNANTLNGGAGDDTIEGGGGNDILVGGANSGLGDTLSYAHDAVGVTVSLALTSAQKTAGEGVDTISGFENLTGGSGNDVLTGDQKANVIAGGPGDDIIVGGLGSDTLTGGGGNDHFQFANPTEGGDTLADFNNAGTDKISIVKAGFGIAKTVTLGGIGTNDFAAHYFVDGATPSEPNHGQFLFDAANLQLLWDPDGTGGKAAVLIAHLPAALTLHATDFELK